MSTNSRMFSCSAIGVAIKTETKNDLVFLYDYIWYSAVFSGKVAMATGHDILKKLHLFEYRKSLKTYIHVAWPVAMASFVIASSCRLALPLTVL